MIYHCYTAPNYEFEIEYAIIFNEENNFMSVINFLIKTGFFGKINDEIYCDVGKIFRSVGSCGLLIYYAKYPEELLQINLKQIASDLLFNFSFAIGVAVIENKLYRNDNKFQENKTKRSEEFTNYVIQNMPNKFFDILPVVGEDIIFLINFSPNYRNNIWLRLLTSTIFATSHLGVYSLNACVFKVVTCFGSLTINKNMINHNITHFAMDYIMLKIMSIMARR